MASKRKASKKPAAAKKSATKKSAPPKAIGKDGRLSVMIELIGAPGGSGSQAMMVASSLVPSLLNIDQNFAPVPMGGGAAMGGAESYIVRGTVKNEAEIAKLRELPEVKEVWPDTPVAAFEAGSHFGMVKIMSKANGKKVGAFGPCPIGTCDCTPDVANGDIGDVATYLGVDRIRASGFSGDGIVVGVVDGGITAVGRTLKSSETVKRRIPRVIGGWPEDDWGTETSKWYEHGNMCATDVLGMAPQAQIYDLRISDGGSAPGVLSRALQAFQWAVDRHRLDGTPHILSNSWGMYQESWDPLYARNPNHPFTRKVAEAIAEGILVLFAAGNCGDTCPSGQCGADNGPGKSIWGANGHPEVMTVGAVNREEKFVGYSSRGPAALDPNKPDFCSVTHFKGYFDSDSGTSAATPILAGALALLKQAKRSLTPAEAKDILRKTAKNIGKAGFDRDSGAGIVRPHEAFKVIGQDAKNLIVWKERDGALRNGGLVDRLDEEIAAVTDQIRLDSEYLKKLVAFRQQMPPDPR